MHRSLFIIRAAALCGGVLAGAPLTTEAAAQPAGAGGKPFAQPGRDQGPPEPQAADGPRRSVIAELERLADRSSRRPRPQGANDQGAQAAFGGTPHGEYSPFDVLTAPPDPFSGTRDMQRFAERQAAWRERMRREQDEKHERIAREQAERQDRIDREMRERAERDQRAREETARLEADRRERYEREQRARAAAEELRRLEEKAAKEKAEAERAARPARRPTYVPEGWGGGQYVPDLR